MVPTYAATAAGIAQAEQQQVALMKQLTRQIEVAIGAIAANTVEPFLASVDLQQRLAQSFAASEVPRGNTVRSLDWQSANRALLASTALYAAVLTQVARSTRLLVQVCASHVARSALSTCG